MSLWVKAELSLVMAELEWLDRTAPDRGLTTQGLIDQLAKKGILDAIKHDKKCNHEEHQEHEDKKPS